MEIINCFSYVHTEKRTKPIEYIVVHYTAGTTSRKASAKNTAEFFRTTNTQVSSDFIVDDFEIVQYNPDIFNVITWHCGGKSYGNKGGKYYGKCTNQNSIGIEICCNNSTNKMQNANDKSYSFSDAALNNTEQLIKYLMQKYNIPAEKIIRHYDVNGKPCPGIIGWNLENGNNENAWIAFKNRFLNNQQKQKAENKTIKYTIQVGAFSEKENAENYLKKVQKSYPNAFIKIKE